MKFTRMPLRFFGLLGAGLFSAGFVIDLVIAAQKIVWNDEIAEPPLLLLGVLLMVLGVQTLSLGVLGEMIIFTHARKVRDYQVAEILRAAPPSEPAEPRETVAEASGTGTARGSALQAVVRRPRHVRHLW